MALVEAYPGRKGTSPSVMHTVSNYKLESRFKLCVNGRGIRLPKNTALLSDIYIELFLLATCICIRGHLTFLRLTKKIAGIQHGFIDTM